MTEIALKGFLAEAKIQKLGSKLSVMKQHELTKQINEGRQASETVCQYVDWLVTSFNPQPPDTEMWVKPSVHPCKRKFSEIADSDSDYVNLLNTKCSTSYCLKKKNNDSDLKCRFNYPFESCEKTTVEFEAVHSKNGLATYHAKIKTKRNDPGLNIHQHLQLHGWRANVDLQVIIDYRVCLECITKYASYPEVKSPVLKKVLDTVLANASVNSATNGTKIIRKLMIKSLGERDFSAQETMHQLFSLKLHSSSFTVIPVSLNACRRIRPNKRECLGLQSTYDSLLDSYASREKFVSFVPDHDVKSD